MGVRGMCEDLYTTMMSVSLGFFWRSPQASEVTIRKAMNTDIGALGGIAGLPVAIISTVFTLALTATQVPILWVLMFASIFAYYKLSLLTPFRMQLYTAREDSLNFTYSRVADHFDLLLPIRALKKEKHFEGALYGGIMIHPYFNYLQFQCGVAAGHVEHIIGAAFNGIATVIVTQMKLTSTLEVTFAFFTMSQSLAAMVRGICQMYTPFMQLVTMYRVFEDFICTNQLEPSGGSDAPKLWPSEGQITFEDVTFRYSPHLPTAVRNLSFSVKAGEKLGVVGKTGSGKSTLVVLLMRLGPLKGVLPFSGGRVLIDGIDVATLKLPELRKHIAVVPQEPTLFPATLKQNIGEEFTDEEVIAALESCGLDARQITQKDASAPVEEALASGIAEGSLSIGQQQLLMASRALVRRPKVMILDECTASLDRESADRLQNVIVKQSTDSTVLSIAHRLRFVADMDRILVLRSGKIIGLDTPAKLLEDENGYYAVNYRLEQQEDSASGAVKAA